MPSCEICNPGFAKDDDYVRLVFTTAEGAIGNPARDELKPKVLRFANRMESKRVLKTFYDRMRTDYLPNENGLFIQRQGFVLEIERLDKYAGDQGTFLSGEEAPPAGWIYR